MRSMLSDAAICFTKSAIPAIDSCTSTGSFSLEGEGWDEGGKLVDFILLTPTLSSRRGRLWLVQPVVFIA